MTRLRRLVGRLLGVPLGVVIISSALLSVVYLPSPAAAVGVSGDSGNWSRVQLGSLWVTVGLVLPWAVLSVSSASRGTGRATVGSIVATGAAVAGCVVALLTWPFVRWDQIALWAVAVGSDWRGFWRPAVSENVRFLFVGGSEVGQGTYLGMVLVHLAAPVLAAVAVLVREVLGRHPGPNAVTESWSSETDAS